MTTQLQWVEIIIIIQNTYGNITGKFQQYVHGSMDGIKQKWQEFYNRCTILLSTASHTHKIYLKCKANSDYFAPSYQTTVECE